MPTWIKCTTLQDDPMLGNLDNVSTRNAKATPNYTTIAFIGGLRPRWLKETPEKIANVKQSHNKDRQ
jgi:hypothetical protein